MALSLVDQPKLFFTSPLIQCKNDSERVEAQSDVSERLEAHRNVSERLEAHSYVGQLEKVPKSGDLGRVVSPSMSVVQADLHLPFDPVKKRLDLQLSSYADTDSECLMT